MIEAKLSLCNFVGLMESSDWSAASGSAMKDDWSLFVCKSVVSTDSFAVAALLSPFGYLLRLLLFLVGVAFKLLCFFSLVIASFEPTDDFLVFDLPADFCLFLPLCCELFSFTARSSKSKCKSSNLAPKRS